MCLLGKFWELEVEEEILPSVRASWAARILRENSKSGSKGFSPCYLALTGCDLEVLWPPRTSVSSFGMWAFLPPLRRGVRKCNMKWYMQAKMWELIPFWMPTLFSMRGMRAATKIIQAPPLLGQGVRRLKHKQMTKRVYGSDEFRQEEGDDIWSSQGGTLSWAPVSSGRWVGAVIISTMITMMIVTPRRLDWSVLDTYEWEPDGSNPAGYWTGV